MDLSFNFKGNEDIGAIVSATNVRDQADAVNAENEACIEIMGFISHAANLGEYYVEPTLFYTGEMCEAMGIDIDDLPRVLMEKVIPLFKHRGYEVTVKHWSEDEDELYGPVLKMELRISWNK